MNRPARPGKRKEGKDAGASALRWIYGGIWLWMVVSFVRPQSIVPPLSALGLGMIAQAILIVGLLRARDFRPFKEPLTRLHMVVVVVLVLGAFKAVNTYWLFQAFVAMLTYLAVFYWALPLVMEDGKYRLQILKLMFVIYAVMGCWVMTHGGRGQGAFLADENDAALALSVGFGFCYPLVRFLPGKAWRALGYGALVASVVGIIVTLSRGGFLGLLAVIMAVAFFSGRLVRTLLIFALLAVAAIPFVPESYKKEMSTISDPAESTRVQRLYMWRIAVQQYMSHPVLGIGAENYPYRVADHEGTPFVQKANIFGRSFGGRSVHSSFFQILPELGTFGALAFLFMALRVLWRGFKLGRKEDEEDPMRTALARATAGGMIPFLVAGAFVSAAYYPHFWMLCGFSACLAFKVRGSQAPAAAR